jgi:hypothetical protein
LDKSGLGKEPMARYLYYGKKISDFIKCLELFDSTSVYWLSEEGSVTRR